MTGIDNIIATCCPRRGGTRRGAYFQGAAADGFNHKGGNGAINIKEVRFIALDQQIGKAYRNLAVIFIAAGNRPRESRQTDRRRAAHPGKERVHEARVGQWRVERRR